MVLKFVVLFIILYLIVRAALNMWAAIRADGGRAPSGSFRDDEPVRRRVQGRSYETVLNIQNSAQRSAAHGSRARRVDDARFTEVSERN
jgi:hypothetical protein